MTDHEASSGGDWGAFFTVVILNAAIAVAILIIFEILRRIRGNQYFFAPRYYENVNSELPPPGRGLFSWIRPVISYNEDKIFETRGLDALMYIRFLKLMVVLFAVLLILGAGILIPVNVTSDNGLSGVPELSMGNVRNSSGRLWIHAGVAVLSTIIVLVLLRREYKNYVQLRIRWMRQDQAHNYTVMYKGIPIEKIKESSAPEYFSRLIPNEVVSAHCSIKEKHLRKLIKKRRDTEKQLLFARASWEQHGTRPMRRTFPLFGRKVDAIEHYEKQIAELSIQIDQQRNNAQANPLLSHVAFVTFNSIGSAHKNSQLTMDTSTKKLQASPAPQPNDVFWEQLPVSRRKRAVGTPIMYFLAACLIVFWLPVVAFAQGLANLEDLSRLEGFGWLDGITNWNPIFRGLVEGFLPVLVLIILTALLPKIIEAIVKVRGVYSKSELSRSKFKIYFLFLVFNIFIVSTLAGGIFKVLNELLDSSASEVFLLLGKSVPAQGLFFIQFVLIYALFKYPMNILRIGPFIISKFKKMRSKSAEECRDSQQPEPFKFAEAYGLELLILVLGLTFAIIAPFILPWTVLFFLMTYLLGKYIIMYIHKPEFDSGGIIWPLVFNRIIASLILSQVVMIGVFVLKEAPSGAIIIPLPFITLIFSCYMHKLYDPPASHLPYTQYPTIANGANHRAAYLDPIYSDQHFELSDNVKDVRRENTGEVEEGYQKGYTL